MSLPDFFRDRVGFRARLLSSLVEATWITPIPTGSTMLFFTRQPRSIGNGISASPARTRTRDARRRARFRPLGEALETRRVLSTFKVNTLLDTVAVNLKTGKDASGHISLRSAIEAANSRPNSDTILLPNGTIKLTIAGANEDNAATGDLDIKGNVTIKGKRASSTIVDGNSLDRVFQVLRGRVQISGLTIQHGQADEGGGLLNSGGQVTLTSVVVANNMALGSSGSRWLTGHRRHRQPGRRRVRRRRRRRGGTRGRCAGRRHLQPGRVVEPLQEHDPDERGAGRRWWPGWYAARSPTASRRGQAGDRRRWRHRWQRRRRSRGRRVQCGRRQHFHFRHNVLGQRGHWWQRRPGRATAATATAATVLTASASRAVSAANGFGGAGGQGGSSGPGEGGGLFNLGAVSLSGKTTTWSGNVAPGGAGGDGGEGGDGDGGVGGNGGASGKAGGDGGSGVGGAGGDGGAGLDGQGGGVLNAGTTFISTAAVIFASNAAGGRRRGGGGGAATAARRLAAAALGSTGSAGGEGGEGEANNGGAGGNGGGAAGGGLINLSGGIVSITAPKRLEVTRRESVQGQPGRRRPAAAHGWHRRRR